MCTVTYKGDMTEGYTVVNTEKEKPTPTPTRKPTPTNTYYFSFKKVWKGQPGGKISFTVYNPDGTVNGHKLNARKISDTEWVYEGWFSREMDYYVIENAMEGYTTIYENKGDHAEVKDRVYNGGTITNINVPKTGDADRPMLWLMLTLIMAMSVATVSVLEAKKRKHRKEHN